MKRFLIFILLLSCSFAGVQNKLKDNSLNTILVQQEAVAIHQDNCENDACATSTFFHFTTPKIIGLLLLIFGAGLANATGIGGGLIMAPILIIFFSYNENNALAIVYSAIFGSSMGNFLNVARRRDKETGKPLVDYEIVVFCMPFLAFGANIGVILGRISAPAVIVLGIVLVSIYNFSRVYSRFKKRYAQETEKIKGPPSSDGCDQQESAEKTPLLSEYDEADESQLRQAFQERYSLFPKKLILILISIIVSNVILSLIRGTQKRASIVGIPYGGVEYWGMFGVIELVCLLFYLISLKVIRNCIKAKEKYSNAEKKGFELSGSHLRDLSLLSLIAGVLAGLLGLGGGTILGPTLLAIGMSPESLGATGGVFIIQTSFISLFQSILYGDVPLSEQVFFLIVSLFGSFMVSLFLTWLVEKYNRSSILLLVLLVLVGLAIIVTPIFEYYSYQHNLKALLEFHPLS